MSHDSTASAATSTRRRSDTTRRAILEAARERFAADGYERATIRAIARDARIDPSMVMRYFGNKEGLFAAASTFDLRMPELPDPVGPGVGALLVRHFLRTWEQNDSFTALLRAGVTNEAAAGRIQDILREQLVPVVRGACPDPGEAVTRATLCASQILGMALTRYVLRFPAATALSEDEVVAWLGPTLERYLLDAKP